MHYLEFNSNFVHIVIFLFRLIQILTVKQIVNIDFNYNTIPNCKEDSKIILIIIVNSNF